MHINYCLHFLQKNFLFFNVINLLLLALWPPEITLLLNLKIIQYVNFTNNCLFSLEVEIGSVVLDRKLKTWKANSILHKQHWWYLSCMLTTNASQILIRIAHLSKGIKFLQYLNSLVEGICAQKIIEFWKLSCITICLILMWTGT